MSDKYIYIASPLGFSEAGRHFMYHELIPAIKQLGYGINDPWKLTDEKLIQSVAEMPYGEEKKQAWKQLNQVIGANNKMGIEKSDGILAILDGVDVDSGTASEIGYAAAHSKPILGYRGDFRLSADNEGSTVNLQVEFFIRNSGGTIVHTLKDVVKELPRIV